MAPFGSDLRITGKSPDSRPVAPPFLDKNADELFWMVKLNFKQNAGQLTIMMLSTKCYITFNQPVFLNDNEKPLRNKHGDTPEPTVSKRLDF